MIPKSLPPQALRSGSFHESKVSWLAADMRGWRENMEDKSGLGW